MTLHIQGTNQFSLTATSQKPISSQNTPWETEKLWVFFILLLPSECSGGQLNGSSRYDEIPNYIDDNMLISESGHRSRLHLICQPLNLYSISSFMYVLKHSLQKHSFFKNCFFHRFSWSNKINSNKTPLILRSSNFNKRHRNHLRILLEQILIQIWGKA